MHTVLKTAALAFALSLANTASWADSAALNSDLGLAAIQAGQWTQAESQLRQELVANPNDPMRLVNLAFVLQRLGRDAEAKEVYRSVLALNTNPLVAVGNEEKVKGIRVKSVANKGIAQIENTQN